MAKSALTEEAAKALYATLEGKPADDVKISLVPGLNADADTEAKAKADAAAKVEADRVAAEKAASESPEKIDFEAEYKKLKEEAEKEANNKKLIASRLNTSAEENRTVKEENKMLRELLESVKTGSDSSHAKIEELKTMIEGLKKPDAPIVDEDEKELIEKFTEDSYEVKDYRRRKKDNGILINTQKELIDSLRAELNSKLDKVTGELESAKKVTVKTEEDKRGEYRTLVIADIPNITDLQNDPKIYDFLTVKLNNQLIEADKTMDAKTVIGIYKNFEKFLSGNSDNGGDAAAKAVADAKAKADADVLAKAEADKSKGKESIASPDTSSPGGDRSQSTKNVVNGSNVAQYIKRSAQLKYSSKKEDIAERAAINAEIEKYKASL